VAQAASTAPGGRPVAADGCVRCPDSGSERWPDPGRRRRGDPAVVAPTGLSGCPGPPRFRRRHSRSSGFGPAVRAYGRGLRMRTTS
jgi:hypothetical protein